MDIPNDIILYIFGFLTTHDLFKLYLNKKILHIL